MYRLFLVGNNSSVNLASRFGYKLRVGTYSNCQYYHVKLHGFAVCKYCGAFRKFFNACTQNKFYALAFDMLLHYCGGLLVQNRGKYPVRKVDNGHVRAVMLQSLCGFQTDKPRADYEDFRSLGSGFLYRLCVVKLHKCEFVLYLIKSLHWGYERL